MANNRRVVFVVLAIAAVTLLSLFAPAQSKPNEDVEHGKPKYGWCRDGGGGKPYHCPPPNQEEPPEPCHCFISGIKVYGCVPETACGVCCDEELVPELAAHLNASLGDEVEPCPLKKAVSALA